MSNYEQKIKDFIKEYKRNPEDFVGPLGEYIPELEMSFAELSGVKKIYSGKCPVCNKKTVFVSLGYWLRGNYECIHCKSIPRQRALVKILDKICPGWREKTIHESSPFGVTMELFKRECKEYSFSYYYEDKPLGSNVEHKATNQNLERMTFDDESFDVFITQDVLEHVVNPDLAFKEIARVLKPGGIHLFTVPLYLLSKTKPRVKVENGELKHIQPPEYHGNPISNQGSLVTYNWGYDIKEIIYENSGMETTIYDFPDSKENFEAGLEAEFLQVLVSEKET